MENDHEQIPGIDWDAVLEAADLDHEGENNEIVEDLVLDDLGEPVGAYGLGLGHGQNENGHHDGQPPEEGQFQFGNHIPNMVGNEDLGMNPNAGFFGAEPGEEALEIVAEELEQEEQQHLHPAFAALAIVPPPPGGLDPPDRQRSNLKRGPPWHDRTGAGPMRLKKPKKPTQ